MPPSCTTRSVVLWGLLVLVFLCGCGEEDLDTTYGKRRGSDGQRSINGTAVLADMMEEAGFEVISWSRLSPKLEDYQVIVWTPDSFLPPSEEERLFLEEWLAAAPGRTLVYVGRDYDAEVVYWEAITDEAPPDQAIEVARRVAAARIAHDRRRADLPDEAYARWFTLRRRDAARSVEQFSSPDSAWADAVDADRAAVEVRSILDIAVEEDMPSADHDYLPEVDVLLQADEDPLVLRVRDSFWEDSQIVVVTNGSFLLNLPLVNREHRKLAKELITEIGPPDPALKGAVFLESGPEGLTILSEEPEGRYPSVMSMLDVWPLNIIILHLLVLGFVFCLLIFPIFGRPRRAESVATSDFGLHVEALGKMLGRSKNRAYAIERIEHYRTHVKHDPVVQALRSSRAQTTSQQAEPPQRSEDLK